MKELSIEDVRTTLGEIDVRAARKMTDNELKHADFLLDLEMGPSKVVTMISCIERSLNIMLPVYVMNSLKVKNTVAVFITAANHYLIDRD